MLLESGQMREDDLSVEFYGKPDHGVIGRMKAACSHDGILTFGGTVGAKQCMEICRSAAVLFLPGYPGHRGLMSGKVFEYLAAQRPILCAPGDGDCIDALLRETGAGVSCHTLDATARQLLEWYREWRRDGTIRYGGNRDAIMKFSRRRQAGQLAAVLESIVGGRPSPDRRQ